MSEERYENPDSQHEINIPTHFTRMNIEVFIYTHSVAADSVSGMFSVTYRVICRPLFQLNDYRYLVMTIETNQDPLDRFNGRR